ncbi:LysE/ArgO family amino acid transporter [Radiobacillus kanasensis]|uniref:LysE/ArgO family amino acid transporter n=1 Tax=Radiobacillus kanasensis TaxID=2844358 RepID=UPI001E4A33B9|nr:LysE/ArgO family amino acid transporter [Radiobacillus kanasensis]UFT99170.1 LysE/ArgO family amino acid transporter [Radiobacillus kanasensis]
MRVAISHGIVLAFGLILPLGVQNVFILNQGATQQKWRRTLPVVITASLCDTLLIGSAVLGVSAIVLASAWIRVTLLTVGILFLIYMGWVTWRSVPKDNGERSAMSPKKQVTFALSVSLLNPHAIMDTIGVIGTSSLTYTGLEKISFAGACIMVSWLWFFGLAIVGRKIGSFDSSGKLLIVINKVSAIIMWGTALYLFLSIG